MDHDELAAPERLADSLYAAQQAELGPLPGDLGGA
jgi:hypothetical protein